MKTFLCFGIESDDLDGARARIERALQITMVLHASDYRGGDYYRCRDDGCEHFILQRNCVDLDEDWMEPEHKNCGLLLYANETDRAEVICGLLANDARLISREVL